VNAVGGILFTANDSSNFMFHGSPLITLVQRDQVNSGRETESFNSGVTFSLAGPRTGRRQRQFADCQRAMAALQREHDAFNLGAAYTLAKHV